jgi:hypothetical protein
MAARSDILLPLALGGVAGIVVGLIVWRVAAKKVEQGLVEGGQRLEQEFAAGREDIQRRTRQGISAGQAEIERAIQKEIRPQVRQQVQASLTEAGLTPQLLADARRVLDLARRAGVI